MRRCGPPVPIVALVCVCLGGNYGFLCDLQIGSGRNLLTRASYLLCDLCLLWLANRCLGLCVSGWELRPSLRSPSLCPCASYLCVVPPTMASSDAAVIDQEIAHYRLTGEMPEFLRNLSFASMKRQPDTYYAMTRELLSLQIFSLPCPILTTELELVYFRRYVLLGEGSMQEVVDSVDTTMVRRCWYPIIDEFRPEPNSQYRVNWEAVASFQEEVEEYVFKAKCDKHFAMYGEKHPDLIRREEEAARKAASKVRRLMQNSGA